jgi:DivIVA domain-containing protein
MRKPEFDVRRRSFTRAFRGLDEAEVEAALGAAAPACEEAHATVRQLEQALADATAEAERLRQGELSVIRVVRSGDEHARMCLASAHRQAARIVEAAEARARQLLERAEEERIGLTNEVRAIERRRDHALSTLGELIEALAKQPPAATLAARAEPVMLAPTIDLARSERRVEAAVYEATVASQAPLAGVSGERPIHPVPAGPRPQVVPANTESDETADGAALEQEPVASATRSLLRFVSTGRAAAVAAAILLSVAAIAWPSARAARERVPAAPLPVHKPVTVPAASLAVPESPVPIVVKVKSSRPCWIRVTVDGNAESLVLAAGEEISRTGENSVRVRVGDAAAATLEVNGRALPPLGRNGEVVERAFSADPLPL